MQTQAYISGEWLDSEIGTLFPVLDPASGEIIGNFLVNFYSYLK